MFSVIKAKKKIIVINSQIAPIPDLWFRGKGSGKYFLCPATLSKQSFYNAASNCFTPSSDWLKIPCQVLESKFCTYQQAKAAEDSITRNLQKQKAHVADQNGNAYVGRSPIPDLTASVIISNANDAASNESNAIGYAVSDESNAIGYAVSDESDAICHETGASSIDADANSIEVDASSIQAICNEIGAISIQTGAHSIEIGDTSIEAKAICIEGAHASCPSMTLSVSGSQLKLPIKEAHEILQLNIGLSEDYQYFRHQVPTWGNWRLATTMRTVCNGIIEDNLLQHYSVEGQRDKLPLKPYSNVINFMVECTAFAHNEHNKNSNDFKPVSEDEVRSYLKSSFIKRAKQRLA